MSFLPTDPDRSRAFTGRTALTLGALGVAALLVRDRIPTLAWGTLVLVLLYLLLTNYAALGAAVDYLTNPASTRR
jgi:hypothetical protein